MSRLIATIRWEITLQWRNGFYAATAFVAAFWAALLLRAGGALDLRWLLPPLLVGNLLIGTFFFLGALVLLERGEDTPQALAVTPLRQGEHLASKVVTLTLLALAESLALTPLLAGWDLRWPLLIAGLALAALIYCLAGRIAVGRHTEISAYLPPAGLYAALLWVPLLAYMAGWRPWPLLLHPLSGPLALVELAAGLTAPWWTPYSVAASLAWAAAWGFWTTKDTR